MAVPTNCDLEENRFVYTPNEELRSLQEIASCQVAHAIWNGYISRCSINHWELGSSMCIVPRFVKLFGLYSTYPADTDKLVECLKTPRSIEKIIKTSLKKIRKEIEQCFKCFYYDNLFCSYSIDIEIRTFEPHWFVWLPNGKIDYMKTAEMMVSSDNDDLSLKVKFATMCEFYMENKLRKFCLSSLPANFIEGPNCTEFENSSRYWVSYLTGREEIDEYDMVKNCILHDGIGGIRINHFWHRLSDDHQVEALCSILINRSSISSKQWQAIEPVLGTISWDQQNRLLSIPEVGETIIIPSCKYSSSSKCAIWAWKHCRDFITGTEFGTIWDRIFSYDFFDGKMEKNVFSAAEELWDLAYDHHRNILITRNKYFYCILDCYRKITEGVDDIAAVYILLKKYLALKSTNERKILIMKFSAHLAACTSDPRYIQEIFDSNLPNSGDQIEFKKYVTNSGAINGHCATLWMNGNFDILDAFVEFLFDGDVISVRKYNHNLFSHIIRTTKLEKFEAKWNEYFKRIDEMQPDDPVEATNKKKKLVSVLVQNRIEVSYCKYLENSIEAVESVFLNETELKHVKAMFIRAHTMYPGNGLWWMWDHFCNDIYFHRMLEWCCDDNEEAVVQLKNRLHDHDTIFNIVLFHLNKVYVTEATGLKMSLLSRLDKYLTWFLSSVDEISAYKIRRLKESHNLEIFYAISVRRDEQSLRMLLEWFLDGDEEKIRDYRSKKMKRW